MASSAEQDHQTAQQQPQQQPQLNLRADIERAIELLQRLESVCVNEPENAAKFRQLHQVLSSPLFRSVRQVYEQVYDTVQINGSPDIRASATAKATVAVFAAGEQHAHPRLVELPKPEEEGLGLNLVGGREQSSPIYISRLIQNSVAERCNQLKIGDQLLAVNGVNVQGENHEKAVELLRAAVGTVSLLVVSSKRSTSKRRMMRRRCDAKRIEQIVTDIVNKEADHDHHDRQERRHSKRNVK